jgi:hypothetical protein
MTEVYASVDEPAVAQLETLLRRPIPQPFNICSIGVHLHSVLITRARY